MKYDHYISLDWAKSNMAIAKMTKQSNKIEVKDVPSDIEELKFYLSKQRGKKILTFEETSTSHWLYVELKEYVDEILVCDPWRNKLLCDGAKTDKNDASKLVSLLKSNMLKPVFHSGDYFFDLRKLNSGYNDLIQAGVRFKNQKKSLLRAIGVDTKTGELTKPFEVFVLTGLDRNINLYEEEKKLYEQEFKKICSNNKLIRNLKSIPGIGDIGAVKLAGIVVNAERFPDKGGWLSYCGLVDLEKMSGGRSYGKRKPRYCRGIKQIFKTAAMTSILEGRDNPFRRYYEYLIKEKNYTDYNARHAVARRIAIVALGVFKSNKKFENKWEDQNKITANK